MCSYFRQVKERSLFLNLRMLHLLSFVRPGNVLLQRYFLVAIYCVLLIINLFTPVLFTVDASGRIKYTGELIDILFFSLFYLIYLLYILPQHCPLKKKLSLIGFVVFPRASFAD